MAKRRCGSATAAACLLAGLLSLPVTAVAETAVTGRFSMLGTTARAGEGDIGYLDGETRTLSADQQSLRLMLDGLESAAEWSLHLKASRLSLGGYPAPAPGASALFRYSELEGEWFEEQTGDRYIRAGYEVDRAFYRHRFSAANLTVGRQPLDWGSGRFWQPFNVFGAFAPSDLDTDYKPGIDGLNIEWYPSAFSSLSAAYILSPHDASQTERSAALHYQRQVGAVSEFKLLAGNVLGNPVLGVAFESGWMGMGWRVEGVQYRLDEFEHHSTARYWIAGVDYQFSDGTLLIAEWYRNSLGAERELQLAELASDPLVGVGIQPYLAREVLGVGLERDLTALLHGSYLLLAEGLDDEAGERQLSLMHQLNFTYSVSNESDLLLSLLWGQGRGLDEAGVPRSDFGHLPPSATLRLRFYF